MQNISSWLLLTRPKTLLVAIAVILLGQSLAFYDKPASFSMMTAVLCMLCCMGLQIAVNLSNDYFDDKNGIDTKDRLGPIRGIQQGQVSAQQVGTAIIVLCAFSVLSGTYLIYLGGWPYIVLGLFSLAGVYLYSGGRYPIASLGLGEAAVFLYFGPIAVVGSYYLQTQMLTAQVFIAASQIGLLVSAIMLVNNVRDIDTDFVANKHTLATRLGNLRSKQLYCIFLLLPSLLILLDPLKVKGMFALLPLQLLLIVLMFKRKGSELNTQLAQTSALVLLWSVSYSFFLF